MAPPKWKVLVESQHNCRKSSCESLWPWWSTTLNETSGPWKLESGLEYRSRNKTRFRCNYIISERRRRRPSLGTGWVLPQRRHWLKESETATRFLQRNGLVKSFGAVALRVRPDPGCYRDKRRRRKWSFDFDWPTSDDCVGSSSGY